MANSESLKWSQVVAKAAGMKVVTSSRSPRDTSTITTDIIYELPEFTQQQLARKAASIIRQALSPESVLFSFPLNVFEHRTDAYQLIIDQIGPLKSIRPLSNYEVRARRDLLIAAKFTCPEHTHAAINSGVVVDDIVYKASPTISGAENPLVRVQINLLHNADDDDLEKGLLRSLKYYGKVYQIRRTLCNGFFEGQLTVVLDPQYGYEDDSGSKRDAQPLQRMLYLEAWDVFAPASFKGAAPICFYCRQAGHIRNACPELAKRVCFGCGAHGHTRRFCRARVNEEQSETELLSQYEQLSNITPQQQQEEDKDPDLEVSVQPIATIDEDLCTDNEDKEMEVTKDQMDIVDNDDNLEELLEQREKTPLPNEGLNASKHAPYDIATTMKVDSPAEMLGISSLKPSTKAKTDKIKRRLLVKSKAPPTSSSTMLESHVVVPQHHQKLASRKGQ